jgi:hypothetical protein
MGKPNRATVFKHSYYFCCSLELMEAKKITSFHNVGQKGMDIVVNKIDYAV